MHNGIAWKEKLPDGVRREVRVTFPGGDQIKWQFLRDDAEKWDYDTPPEVEQWATLLKKMENLYSRTRIPYKKLELARKAAAACLNETITNEVPHEE